MLYIRKIQEKIRRWLLKEEVILLNGARPVGNRVLNNFCKVNMGYYHFADRNFIANYDNF